MNQEEDAFDESYVYEEFSGIRTSFENLIDRYGYEAIEDTMKRVVKVLSTFEALISSLRQAKLQLVNAQLTLEEEKESSAQKDQTLQQKMRIVKDQNAKLSEKNAELQRKLREFQSSSSKKPVEPVLEADTTSEVMEKLNNVIETQNKTLTELKDEYEELSAHNTRQSALILKLKAGLQESVHSHRTLKTRNDRLCAENAKLGAQLAGFEGLETSGHVSNDRRGSTSSKESIKSSTESQTEDRDVMQARLDYKRSASEIIRSMLGKQSQSNRNRCTCVESGYKFTVDEMTMLLNERNIAKEKLFIAEEELAFYRNEQDNLDVVTEEGFALLEPPQQQVPSPITKSLFSQLSRSEETT